MIVPRLEADGQVTVDMGVPEFEPARIPFEAPRRAPTYPLEVGGSERRDQRRCRWAIRTRCRSSPTSIRRRCRPKAPLIERHARFPQRVNAGYAQVVDRSHIRLRVFERGAGETLACGTGACAAVVAGIQRGLLDARVTVTTRGGELSILWEGEGKPVMMTGPAVTVFEGEMELSNEGMPYDTLKQSCESTSSSIPNFSKSTPIFWRRSRFRIRTAGARSRSASGRS